MAAAPGSPDLAVARRRLETLLAAAPGDSEHARTGDPTEDHHRLPPQEGEDRELFHFPYIRQPGLLRLEIFSFFPDTDPQDTVTFNVNMGDIPDDDPCWEDNLSFSRYMRRSIWYRLCDMYHVRDGDFPTPDGDFDPPIGCSRFRDKVWARGAHVDYIFEWPEGWADRQSAPPTPPPSQPTSPQSATCSSTRVPGSPSPPELLPSSPPPSADEPPPADTEGRSSPDPERLDRRDSLPPTQTVVGAPNTV